jgi:hypothetical protein
MTPKEFAAMLNGRQYSSEITRQEAKIAKDAGFLVVYGASDDLLELRGICDDELGAYDGTKIKFRLDKMEPVKEDACQDCLARTTVFDIKAEWCPKDLNASWRITPSVYFEPFDIMEDEVLFCRGAVINVGLP